MNYAEYKEYIENHQRELVKRFGIPEYAAKDIAQYAETTGIAEEAKAKNEDQYKMNFTQYGARVMGNRHKMSAQAARKRFNKLIQKNIPMVARTVT